LQQQIEELNNQVVELPTEQEVIDTSDWQTYRNEEYGFTLEFPSTWDGYFSGGTNYPNYSYVGFSFKDDNRRPFTIFQIVRYNNQQWELIGGKVPQQKILSQSDDFTLVCDGCCYEDGDFTGGGQFDEFQKERCKEASEIVKTFSLID